MVTVEAAGIVKTYHHNVSFAILRVECGTAAAIAMVIHDLSLCGALAFAAGI